MKFKINKKLKKKVLPESVVFKDVDPFIEEFLDETVDVKDKTVELLEEGLEKNLRADFEIAFPGKHAVWGGKETKAYLKWKADNNL